MAIFHLSIKIISRGKGKSAVAAAAYRAGELIKSEYDGIINDYTRKGGVVHTEILLPSRAPAKYADRASLWNAVELGERNKNAQLAREIELALPVELTLAQNREMVRRYCQRQFVDKGMCADICFHDKKDGNPHAHVLLTLRPIAPDGSWAAKSKKEYITDRSGERILLPNGAYKTRKEPTVDWNEPTKAEEWRAAWADAVNTTLERQGVEERIDHRSFARQGKEEIPTVHLGVAATQMERKGIATGRGDTNREIVLTNSHLRQLRARIVKLQNWLKEETAKSQPATLSDRIQAILSRQEQSPHHSQHLSRYPGRDSLAMLAEMVDYLTKNDIHDMAGLRAKTIKLYDRQSFLGSQLNHIDQRIKALDKNLQQAEVYREHKDLYAQYQAIRRPKKQTQFREEHYTGIALFEAAKRHLDGAVSEGVVGATALPVKAWRAERDGLSARRNELSRKYATLKSEVREIEQVRRGLDYVLWEENRRVQPQQKEKIERARGRER